ncbi:MAG: TauD/TfdA family dioxygenase [Cyanobacteria bacterium J06635_15]
MMNVIESLGASTGKIVHSDKDCLNILELPITEIMELFKSSGVLLFRGFGVTPGLMKTFSNKFSRAHITDFTKKSITSDKFVNFVDNGTINRIAHSERAYLPLRPDVIWFCCTVPAEKGGETLFWDGVRVWEELSEASKKLFLSKKLKFRHEVSSSSWEKHKYLYRIMYRSNSLFHQCLRMTSFFAFLMCQFTNDLGALVNLKQALEELRGVSFQIDNEKQTGYFEYVCSAVAKTRYGNQNAFANSFWVYQKKTEKSIFEDDSRASDEVADEIEGVLERLVEEIPWQSGDLVMIDNSRFLHGRREFYDERRQVFTTLSNLRF